MLTWFLWGSARDLAYWYRSQQFFGSVNIYIYIDIFMWVQKPKHNCPPIEGFLNASILTRSSVNRAWIFGTNIHLSSCLAITECFNVRILAGRYSNLYKMLGKNFLVPESWTKKRKPQCKRNKRNNKNNYNCIEPKKTSQYITTVFRRKPKNFILAHEYTVGYLSSEQFVPFVFHSIWKYMYIVECKRMSKEILCFRKLCIISRVFGSRTTICQYKRLYYHGSLHSAYIYIYIYVSCVLSKRKAKYITSARAYAPMLWRRYECKFLAVGI